MKVYTIGVHEVMLHKNLRDADFQDPLHRRISTNESEQQMGTIIMPMQIFHLEPLQKYYKILEMQK
jgi:hypothetical protein